MAEIWRLLADAKKERASKKETKAREVESPLLQSIKEKYEVQKLTQDYKADLNKIKMQNLTATLERWAMGTVGVLLILGVATAMIVATVQFFKKGYDLSWFFPGLLATIVASLIGYYYRDLRDKKR